MLAYEIFQKIPAELATSVIDWMRDDEKQVYKATLTALTQQKKLRPIFIERRPRAEQVKWVAENMKLRISEAVCENVLQIWLMKTRQPMLVSFLNLLGIKHDGHGGVDSELPKSLSPEKATNAVESLVANYPKPEIAVYLNLFQLQQPGGWPELQAAMEEHPELLLA